MKIKYERIIGYLFEESNFINC